MAWDDRFRQISAAKKRQHLRDGVDTDVPRRVANSEIERVRAIDPSEYLRGGYIVKNDGKRHRSVRTSGGGEVYRLTDTGKGLWLW